MEIRDARPEDAPACCVVLRRSIVELCAADHRNDQAALEDWLSNKTVENVVRWIEEPHASFLVVVDNPTIVAVGSVSDAGDIGLNYVLPEARFRGISRALLGALEARAEERGSKRCTLSSTITAKRFYLSNDYIETGAADSLGAGSGVPMTKKLHRRTGEPA